MRCHRRNTDLLTAVLRKNIIAITDSMCDTYMLQRQNTRQINFRVVYHKLIHFVTICTQYIVNGRGEKIMPQKVIFNMFRRSCGKALAPLGDQAGERLLFLQLHQKTNVFRVDRQRM